MRRLERVPLTEALSRSIREMRIYAGRTQGEIAVTCERDVVTVSRIERKKFKSIDRGFLECVANTTGGQFTELGKGIKNNQEQDYSQSQTIYDITQRLLHAQTEISHALTTLYTLDLSVRSRVKSKFDPDNY